MPSTLSGKPRQGRSPTITSRIEATLREADDFLRPSEILAKIADPEVSLSHVYSCLDMLKKAKAADFAHEAGKTFWYLTPETDTRCRRVGEKVLHGPGSRGGKARTKTTPKDIVFNPGGLSATTKEPS